MTFYHDSFKAPYGGCDSFFIETDEGRLFTRREDVQEKARADAQAKQRVIGGELSRITAEEYQDDILDHMQHMEVGD